MTEPHDHLGTKRDETLSSCSGCVPEHMPRACGDTPTARSQEQQAYIDHKADEVYLDQLLEEHYVQLAVEPRSKETFDMSDSPLGLNLVPEETYIDDELRFDIMFNNFGALALKVEDGLKYNLKCIQALEVEPDAGFAHTLLPGLRLLLG
jgi:hypothetical protein